MRFTQSRSLLSRAGGLLVAAGCLLTPHAASAQYTFRVLTAPAGPGLTVDSKTEPYAINNRGQVFGSAIATPNERRPVLWATNGMPANLPVPADHSWDAAGGQQFLNDNGTVVTKISPNLPGEFDKILRWKTGGAPEFVPPTPPSTLSPPSCSSSYVAFYPMGLNNLEHVLILATGSGGSCPWMLWIWDGAGSAPSHFQEITPVNNGPMPCSPTFLIRFDGPHLNDADHIALAFGARDWTSCPGPFTAGILANGTYTPRVLDLQPGSGIIGIGGINNHDQFVAFAGANNAPDMQLWDGVSAKDLGAGSGPSLNDLGHVLFTTRYIGGSPRLYKNGATTDVPLPSPSDFLPGFFLNLGVGFGGTTGINTTGQILMSLWFDAGAPGGPATYHPVLLTPTPPTLTLRVNGQHPDPPIVATTGPLALTLDISDSAYTAPLAWYWGLVINNQLIWITGAGLSTTPAPLFVAPPVAIANATLLNTILQPHTTLTSFFILVGGGGSPVIFDNVTAARP